MAITVVGQTTKIIKGDIGSVNSITIDLPTGLQLDDLLHIAVFVTPSAFLAWDVDKDIARSAPVRVSLQATPSGWTRVGTGQSLGATLGLRRIVGGPDSSVTIPIGIYQDWRLNVSVKPDESLMQLTAAAVCVAHRGVDLNRIYAAPPLFKSGGSWWNTNTPPNSSLVQLRFSRGQALNPNGIEVGDYLPALPDPFPTSYEPPAWDVLTQERLQAFKTADAFEFGTDTIHRERIFALNAAVMSTDTYTPGVGHITNEANPPDSIVGEMSMVFSLIDPTTSGFPTDDAPPAGIIGLTGSGWLVPEWIGRTQRIINPLECTVWVEDPSGTYGPELMPAIETDFLQPVALDANFNGLGACTTASATFPENPGLTPWQHVLKFALVQPEDDYDGTVWWTGVVKNVRADNGLYRVDLEGLWVLLNNARVQLDPNDVIARPQHGVIMDTLMFGGGDPLAVEIENDADRQQTWSDYLNKTFRISPDAAWGIGPDQAFTMGLPEYAGVYYLDVDNAAITSVEGGEFILPPYVTEWWAEASDGTIHAGSLVYPPGLLTPDRLVKSRLGDLNNLITPSEASLPTHAGPSHTIEVAGIAVPPMLAVGLPSGDQMVASASVSVTLGEEGAMPRVTTTLTTVALPYERS